MRFAFWFLLLIIFLVTSGAGAQSGCTDSLALNFDSAAQINDGSCSYAPASLTLLPLTSLPADLQEISGLTFDGEKWWAHNDGSGDAVFYRIQPENGQVLQKVHLNAATNKDWEEINAGQNNLLVGDFGNNYNDRLDLGIYSIPLDEIGAENELVVPNGAWKFIPFSFPDQTNFTTVPRDSTTHDCEAMIWRNGKIHLFTKNWKFYQTNHYTLHPATGTTTLLENFDVGGLVSGAAISPDSQLVALLCYDIKNQYSAFAWLLWDWPDTGGDLLFSGNKRRIDFGSILFAGQVEGIAFRDNRSGYISNERSSAGGTFVIPQSLKAFDFTAWVPDESLTSTDALPTENLWQINPTLFSDHISVNTEAFTAGGQISIYNLNGSTVFSMSSGGSAVIDTSGWPPGMYLINFSSDVGRFSSKLLKIK